MSNLVEIRDLIKKYPVGGSFFTALKDVNLDFSEGEFSGIVGPSGSGKTTLLNIIGSLDKRTSGSVKVLDKELEKLSSGESAKLRSESIGFIFQSYNLLQHYSVYENVEFPLLLLNMTNEQRKKAVMDALEWVELTDKIKSRPGQLSGGQCQRVAIARAMVKKPPLLLADEPTANLDSDNSYKILDYMKNICREMKTTFIFSTHDSKVINYLNRKIHLVDGKVEKDILTAQED